MKIIWIERKQKTETFQFTKIKFKTWLGKEFVATCITDDPVTRFYDSGKSIPFQLWHSVVAFLESDMDYLQP
jgi:hypothetical protein